MNEEIRKVHEELKRVSECDDIKGVLAGDVLVSKKKQYTPRSSTIEGVAIMKKQAIEKITEFSPFRIGVVFNFKDKFYEFFKIIFPFNELQIIQMDEVSKIKVLENGLLAISACLIEGRDLLMPKDRMFHDTFQLNKLKYIVENGEEPKYIYDESDFEYYLNEAMVMFRISAKGFLRLNGHHLSTQGAKDVLLQFFERCLIRFEIDNYWMEAIRGKYFQLLKTGQILSAQNIEEYRKYINCPITYEFQNAEAQESMISNSFKINRLAACVGSLEGIKNIVSPGNFVRVLQSIVNVALEVENKVRDGEDINKILKDELKQDVMRILTSLPKAIELSKEC